jgi:hypothetical protein
MRNAVFKIDLGPTNGPFPISGTLTTDGSNNMPKAVIDFNVVNSQPNFDTKCVFDVYSMRDQWNTYFDPLANGSGVPCSKGDDALTTVAWNNSFRHAFGVQQKLFDLNVPYSAISSTAGSSGGKNYCHFEVDNYNCDSIYFSALNVGWGLSFLASDNSIINPNDGSAVTEYPSIGDVNGVTFLCGPNNEEISFESVGFKTKIVNDYFNTNSDFKNAELEFIPISTATGDMTIGDGVNANGSVNDGFKIQTIQDQSGEFHLKPVCELDINGNYHLNTILQNVSMDFLLNS